MGWGFIVVLFLIYGDFIAVMTLFDLTLQDLPLPYYLAVIAQVTAGHVSLFWQYYSKSMSDIITFSENGITQHRAEVVAEIEWNGLMEVGDQKRKQFPHSIPDPDLHQAIPLNFCNDLGAVPLRDTVF